VGNTPRTFAVGVMSAFRSQRVDTWDICSRDLVSRHSRFRLRRYARSPFIYVRELAQGKQVREFSLGPLEHANAADVEKVRDLCLEGHRSGQWPAHCFGKPTTQVESWSALTEACITDIERRIRKEGSRVHAINDLRLRIARFRNPVDPQHLLRWCLELDPVTSFKSFNRRIETLSQMQRSGLLDLAAVQERLRAMRPKGAAEKIRKASSMRVRVIPSDDDLQHWLDRLEPFHRWVFGCIATYGLRPHELWHAEGIDGQGWISIPGDMKTKTGEHRRSRGDRATPTSHSPRVSP